VPLHNERRSDKIKAAGESAIDPAATVWTESTLNLPRIDEPVVADADPHQGLPTVPLDPPAVAPIPATSSFVPPARLPIHVAALDEWNSKPPRWWRSVDWRGITSGAALIVLALAVAAVAVLVLISY
jgi:hypothetical protein